MNPAEQGYLPYELRPPTDNKRVITERQKGFEPSTLSLGS